MFEVVEKLRAEPGAPGLLHCNGTLIHRKGDGRTLLNWGHNETRALWTAMYKNWAQQADMRRTRHRSFEKRSETKLHASPRPHHHN